MNSLPPLSHSPATSSTIWLATLMAHMLVGCISSPPPSSTQPQIEHREVRKLSLEQSISRIQWLLGKRLGEDPLLSSLESIESFIRGQLQRDGYRSTVSAHIAPFTPANTGIQYLGVCITTEEETQIFHLAQTNSDVIEVILSPIFETFRDWLQKIVKKEFEQIVTKNNGHFLPEEWEKSLWAVLQKHSHIFIKHGFEFKYCRMIRDTTTGEIKIILDIGNTQDDEIIQIPIWTDFFDNHKPEPREQRGERAELLFAQA
jgi:hypothetical protein